MELNPKQRDKISGILIDVGKIIFAALVIGQFLPNVSFNIYAVAWGLLISLSVWFIGVALLRKEE